MMLVPYLLDQSTLNGWCGLYHAVLPHTNLASVLDQVEIGVKVIVKTTLCFKGDFITLPPGKFACLPTTAAHSTPIKPLNKN